MKYTVKRNNTNHTKEFANKQELIEFVRLQYARVPFGENYHLDKVRANKYVSVYEIADAIRGSFSIVK